MVKGPNVKKVLHRDAFTLPDNPAPEGTRCFQITIPDDNQWEETLFSCLGLLGKWNSFQQDGAHIAADVALKWKQILYFGGITRCKKISPSSGGIDDEEGDMLRVNPDNPCELQVFCAGTWEHFWGPEDCSALAGSGQPSGGGTLEVGDCLEFDAVLSGNGSWLLPVAVSPGYTIEITDAHGGWSDGSIPFFPPWTCPDGSAYELGGCGAPGPTDPSDPLPTATHMSLIGACDGQYFAAYNTTVVIPNDVAADSQFQFWANDSNPADNLGSIFFHVKVCGANPTEVDLFYSGGASGPSSVAFEVPFNVSISNYAPLGYPNGDVRWDFAGDVEVVNTSGYTNATHPTATQWTGPGFTGPVSIPGGVWTGTYTSTYGLGTNADADCVITLVLHHS